MSRSNEIFRFHQFDEAVGMWIPNLQPPLNLCRRWGNLTGKHQGFRLLIKLTVLRLKVVSLVNKVASRFNPLPMHDGFRRVQRFLGCHFLFSRCINWSLGI